MKVLVTGATSMIGRMVVDRLVERGDEVTTLQRSPGPAPAARTVRGSITDADPVAEACVGQDLVIHLAAKVGVTGTRDEFEQINVGGTRLLLDAARHAGVHGFVHVSSPSVAHAGSSLVAAPAGPADPAATRGAYATTKADAERLALGASTDDFPVVTIRPHLVWGPGDTQLIGRIVERARSGRLALVGSGSALIDTTVVDNAADALVAAADGVARLGGQVFVVSNGEPRTVHELVTRIIAAAGLSWRPRRVPTRLAVFGGSIAERVWDRTGRTDDPPMTAFLAEQLSTAHWFDQTTTRSALGWEPSVSLDEGFDRLASWFRDHPVR
jgi:nucleoside-diphosphate-sugar epimerase